MNALKINFEGAGHVSIDWGNKVTGLAAVTQRAGVAIMTQLGSDRFLPTRGTEVTSTLLSYGVFDFIGMQHVLNFGALKARRDMQDYEDTDRADEASISEIRLTLIGVQNNAAQVGVTVTNAADETTLNITEIA